MPILSYHHVSKMELERDTQKVGTSMILAQSQYNPQRGRSVKWEQKAILISWLLWPQNESIHTQAFRAFRNRFHLHSQAPCESLSSFFIGVTICFIILKKSHIWDNRVFTLWHQDGAWTNQHNAVAYLSGKNVNIVGRKHRFVWSFLHFLYPWSWFLSLENGVEVPT